MAVILCTVVRRQTRASTVSGLWPLVWVVDQGWWGSEGRLTGRETPVRRGWREVGHLGKRADRCRGAGRGDKWGVGPW